MTDNKIKSNEKLIPCEECLKEIPISETKVDEANDYVAYFCGADCYDKWRHENNTSR